MNETIKVFSPSDFIEIIGIIMSLITSIIAIVVSIKTLRQNNKMIEESTRPYITISKETVCVNNPHEYFLLKNYGSSGAYIKCIECNTNLDNIGSAFGLNDRNGNPFFYLKNTFLAPNQSICAAFNSKEIENYNIVFTIHYSSETRKYETQIPLNLKQDYNILHTKDTSKENGLELIAKSLQENIVKNL